MLLFVQLTEKLQHDKLTLQDESPVQEAVTVKTVNVIKNVCAIQCWSPVVYGFRWLIVLVLQL